MKFKILLFSCLLAGIMYHCDEDDLVQLDPNRVTPESFFQTAEQLDAAVISGYATLRAQHLTLRHYYIMHDLMDDQHTATSAMQIAPELTLGQQNPSSRHVRELFDAYYDMIHRMNTALDGIAANTTVDEATKTGLEAEAKFLRGWAYNEVATLWGRGPIYLTRALSTEDYQPVSMAADIFAQAQSDLRFAVDNLDVENTLGRANKGAARGFLARSLMQSGDISAAKEVLEDIVEMDRYMLLDNFQDNFIIENDFKGEALFEVIFAPNGGYNWDDAGDGWGGANSQSARAQEYGPFWRNAVPSQTVIDQFESTRDGDYIDPRFEETIILNGDTYGDDDQFTININANSPPIVYQGEEILANFYKYGVYYRNEEVPGFILTSSNLILMRYADVLLLLAEAEARTNGDLSRARSLINQVRDRVGARSLDEAGIPNANANEIMNAVIMERALELVSEQVRGRDLRRWHAAGIVNAEQLLGYSESRFLLPLPLDEILNNPMITNEDQNPGYN